MAGAPDVVIALDVDGVLIDPVGRHPDGWQALVCPRFGLTREELRAFFVAERWEPVMVGDVTIEDALARFFEDKDVDAVAFLEAWLEDDLCVNEEVASAAEEWAKRGARIVLATNQEHRRAARLRDLFADRFGPLDLFYSAHLGVGKPDAKFFHLVDERVGAGDVVFMDDALGNVEAARAHGWKAIHYPHDADWREQVDGYFK